MAGPTKPAWGQVSGGPTGWGYCQICGKDQPASHDFTHGGNGGKDDDGDGTPSTYGVVVLVNETDFQVTYSVRAYGGGGWTRRTLQPGIAPTDAREQTGFADVWVREIGKRNRRDPFDAATGPIVSRDRTTNLASRIESLRGEDPKGVFEQLCDETQFILNGLDTLRYWKTHWDRRNQGP
jgi:hypothetical protein